MDVHTTNYTLGYRLKTANREPLIWPANSFPRGEGAPQGRMRNGDTFWYRTPVNKNIQRFKQYLFYEPNTKSVRIAVPHQSRCARQLPPGGSDCASRQCAKFRFYHLLHKADSLNPQLYTCWVKPICTLSNISLRIVHCRLFIVHCLLFPRFCRETGCFLPVRMVR